MARTPVVFIPGITGSFNLSVLLDWRGPTLSGWGFPPFVDYGKQFVAAFERAGYKRDRDLFVAFYDWRKSVRDSAENYLKPWIARARQRSGSNKVILIGHSMGGLVARTYIQSPNYAHDVEHLITLGTPHRGSAESYYAWGAGDPRADGVVQTAFNVYLWYLRHAHPFQTDLNPVRTFRTQLPGVRDLLPIDNYLLNQGGPPLPKDEDSMIERNLWSDMLNQSVALANLVGRVKVTTMAGSGFSTIRSITVGGPPIPPGSPPLYPDGTPVGTQVETTGDGTVLLSHAQLNHPQARNLAAVVAGHSALPDHPAILTNIFAELGVTSPALDPPPAESTKLVIMTASPVTMDVETPAGRPMAPPGVLGAAIDESAPSRRSRRMRARDHGHAGKHLNIVVIDQPPAGNYNVRLHGTATGSFALGAMIVGATSAPILLGGSGEDGALNATTPTNIRTFNGSISADADLHFEVICQDAGLTPQIRLNQRATARDAISRLRTALQTTTGGLLGAGMDAPVTSILGGVAAPDEMRQLAERAITGDSDALEQVGELLSSSASTAMADMLCKVAEEGVGGVDETTAQAIITQLRALG